LPTTKETPGVAPWFNVYRPTDLAGAVAATGQTLPVVVWADGGCVRSAFTWEPLYDRWAAGGFVVLALDAEPDASAYTMTSVADQDALLDWTLQEAQKNGSPYMGKLDTKRIVAAGNSCGGVTALGVAAKDKRVAAVFVLSGSSALGSTNTSVMAAISVPVGYVEGGTEDISRAAAMSDYAALSPGIPAMIVSRSSGNHLMISTDPTNLAQEAEISLDWMDLSLYGTKEAFNALTSATLCSGCQPGIWTLTSKNLETLEK
jgi:predicted dienelactone hydrolase